MYVIKQCIFKYIQTHTHTHTRVRDQTLADKKVALLAYTSPDFVKSCDVFASSYQEGNMCHTWKD